MEKCLISLHSGIFIHVNHKQDIEQNNIIKEKCNFKIIYLQFP